MQTASRAPIVRCVATSSVLHSAGVTDVLTPAHSVRRLHTQIPKNVDLSLARSLSTLQLDDGSFDLSSDLAMVLGLRNPPIVLEGAGESVAANRLAGALLVLKTVATFNSGSWDSTQQCICDHAAEYCCHCLSISEALLWNLLQNVENAMADLQPFTPTVTAMLRANFGPHMLWSQCDVWVPLLSNAAKRSLKNRGGVLCPRNFLVQLATASRSTHDFRQTYFLYRQNGMLFVGTVATEEVCIDAMRQGRHLEAALVSFGWLQEDRVLMEATFSNGLLACYAGAPDATVDRENAPTAPLVAGDEAGYTAVGYELSETFDDANGGSLRIWRAAQAVSANEQLVEIKKTTHIRGASGQYKQAKFWMQAALGACGAVVVATTGDTDVASSFEQYTLDELAARIPNPSDMWTELAQHLQDIMNATASRDGAWTLDLSMRRHGSVKLYVKPGWDGYDHLHDSEHILRAIHLLEAHELEEIQTDANVWEMECGQRWAVWRTDGLEFEGVPGEVLEFEIAGNRYRVVFGPNAGEGVQVNLGTGRERKLRRAVQQDSVEPIARRESNEDAINHLCDMGFSRADVVRCLGAARGDMDKAVQQLLSSARM